MTLWLAGILLYSNHQRPGAIVNATLREYEDARMVEEGRKRYKVILVSNHKMGTTGRAKIIVALEISHFLYGHRFPRKVFTDFLTV